jgi:SAM-dependent methyltransferase
MPYCSICQQTVSGWLPHPQKEQRSPLMTILDAVGSDLSIYGCPSCHCNDRLRHLWLYMMATGIAEKLKGSTLLHIAPEVQLERMLTALGPAHYIRGDLYPTRPDHIKLDIEELPLKNDTLDVILCNHVLEHVNEPIKALSEMHRCLKDGGLLIAQTPYAPSIKKTFELYDQPDAPTAKLLFGQEDHVRLFGNDITDYFHAAGFKGELLSHASLLPDIDAQDFGCNAREPFFVFWKEAATEPQAPAKADAVALLAHRALEAVL